MSILFKLYLVRGVRHSCVVLATKEKEAVEKAKKGIEILAGDIVSEWEAPSAAEIKLPEGWELRKKEPLPVQKGGR